MNKQTEEALKMAKDGFIKIGNDDEVTSKMLEICVENKKRIEKALQQEVYKTSKLHSPTMQWQTLTDDDIDLFIFEHTKFNVNIQDDLETIKYFKNCIYAIEQALKEKNT